MSSDNTDASVPLSTRRHGVIEASSYRSESGPFLPGEHHYDLAVLFSSWDHRCLNPTLTDLTANTAMLVLFDYMGSTNRRADHDQKLLQFAADCAESVVVIRGSSTALYPLWDKMRDVIIAHAEQTARPMRVYVDLSAASRFYALGAVAAAIEAAAESVTVTYSEAYYDDAGVDEHEMFTIGTWQTVAVPGLEGLWEPDSQRNWIVALGFEGSKTFRAVTKADPDRLAVLMPDPAVREDYLQRTLDKNADLIREYAVPPEQVEHAAAGDAVAAWSAIADLAGRFAPANLDLVCAGTKPHALAMALMSITTDTPAVLYLKPDAHKESSTTPIAQYWTYYIRNHAVPARRGVGATDGAAPSEPTSEPTAGDAAGGMPDSDHERRALG